MVLKSSLAQVDLHPLDLWYCDRGLVIHVHKVTNSVCHIHIYCFNRNLKKKNWEYPKKPLYFIIIRLKHMPIPCVGIHVQKNQNLQFVHSGVALLWNDNHGKVSSFNPLCIKCYTWYADLDPESTELSIYDTLWPFKRASHLCRVIEL